MTNFDMPRLRAISKNYDYIRFALKTDDDVRKVTRYFKHLGFKWSVGYDLEKRPLATKEAVYIRCETMLEGSNKCLLFGSIYNNPPLACYNVDLTTLKGRYKIKRGDL